MNSKLTTNLATAMFPNVNHQKMLELLEKLHKNSFSLIENPWLDYDTNYLQICPQTTTALNIEVLGQYLQLPFKKIRFHANLRLEKQAVEAYVYSKNISYWNKLRELAHFAKMDVYTLHPGRRIIKLEEIKENQKWLSDFLEIEVGIEGLYPEVRGSFSVDHWLINSWNEYKWLLNSNMPYVIDCSHIQIVAYHEKKLEKKLLKELLLNEKCVEVHISDNDFKHDSHQEIRRKNWWFEILEESILERKEKKLQSVVFCESQIKNRIFL